MRIALFPDDYLPNSTLVHAKMIHELAIELKSLGHEPVVITPSQGKQAERLQINYIDGIEIWRFKNPKTKKIGKCKRLIGESLLSFNAYLALKNKKDALSFDACINYSPSIFWGPLMLWFKRKANTFNYLIVRDLFPQWAIDNGIISRYSPITMYFRIFEKILYNASDCLGLMSQANVDYFSQLYPKYKNLQVLRNWAEAAPTDLEVSSIDIRKKYGLEDKVIFFYGGNIGHAQDMANLLRLVSYMKSFSKAHFLFIGQGDEFELVKETKKSENLFNLTLLPSITQEEYKKVLCVVDIGLFSLSKNHKAHNFPGKLLGYMVQSLPILGSVNQGNDLTQFINDENAGFSFVNGDDQSLHQAAVLLLEDKALRIEKGLNAYQVLKKYFSVQSIASQLLESVEKGKLYPSKTKAPSKIIHGAKHSTK